MKLYDNVWNWRHVMNQQITMQFDFDRWMQLSQDDPERFEKLRRQVIEEQISKATPANQARLRGLQFQIDAKRRISGSALGACIEISGMMFDHFSRDLLTALNTFIYGDIDTIKATHNNHNNIIPLYRNQL